MENVFSGCYCSIKGLLFSRHTEFSLVATVVPQRLHFTPLMTKQQVALGLKYVYCTSLHNATFYTINTLNSTTVYRIEHYPNNIPFSVIIWP